MDPLPKQLEGDRIMVRCWEEHDAPAISALIEASLDHLRPWMAWAAHEPMSPGNRRRLIADWKRYWESAEGAVYGVFVDEEPVGGGGLHRRLGAGELDLAYWLGAAYTGQGLATEVAKTLTDGAFTLPDIEAVEIHHDAANVASGRVPERLGFEHVGDELHGQTLVSAWRMHRHTWADRAL